MWEQYSKEGRIKPVYNLNNWAELKYCLHRKRTPNFFEADLAIWTIWSLQDKLEDIWRPKILTELRGGYCQGRHLGGAGGVNCPCQDSSCPPKPQLAPHILQAPRSNSSWFSIIPTEIQMCHHFNITFSYILYVFCLFVFLWLGQGRSQGRLESDKKLIFKGSPALLEWIFVSIFCWNTLLMWLQKTHKIAQNQKIFLEGAYSKPPPPHTPTRRPPCWLGLLCSPSHLCPPTPQEKSEMTPLNTALLIIVLEQICQCALPASRKRKG